MTWDFYVFKSNPNSAVNLRIWGGAGFVTDSPDGKSRDFEIKMMLPDYLVNRESDSVCNWDP